MVVRRTTEQIHEDITRVTTAYVEAAALAGFYADLGKLWREIAWAADREKMPGWTVLAAALLADDYDRRAREQNTGGTR